MAWTVILKGLGVVALLGSTVAVPVTVSKFFGPKPIELKDLQDYKKHCVVIGPKDDPQILGCQVTTTGQSVDFYLYKKNGDGTSNPSFAKIKSVSSETTKLDGKPITVKLNTDPAKKEEKEKTETVKLDKSNKWVETVNGLDLKGRCKTDWSKLTKEKKQKIRCKNNKEESKDTDEFVLFSESSGQK